MLNEYEYEYDSWSRNPGRFGISRDQWSERHLLLGLSVNAARELTWIPVVLLFEGLRVSPVLSLWPATSAAWFAHLDSENQAELERFVATTATKMLLGTPPKDLINRYGSEIGGWLWQTLRLAFVSLEHSNNYRWAEVGELAEEAEYTKARDAGCCGVHDIEVTHPTGRRFKLGCNYGH